MTSAPGGLIDTHQHAMPAAVKKMLVDQGRLPAVGGPPFANWALADALETMDACGIEMGILSAAIPSEFLGDEAFATAITRAANEGIAEAVRDHPDRFGLLAYLPLPFVDAALEEIAYAFDALGADGVVIGSHAGDAYLGDVAFDKVFAELDRRRAVVLTHPFNLPSCGVTPLPPFLADFMLDTTRAAVALITSGTVARCPGISFVLPHAGGFLPYSAARLGLATFLGSGVAPDQIESALRSFHYDTAGPMSPYATPSLLAAAGVDRILYGSDYNAIPRPGIAAGVAALRADPALDAAALARIGRDNALALFPSLARRLTVAAAPQSPAFPVAQ